MTPIIVHPDYGPMPVAPCPDTPSTERRLRALWRRQADIALAKYAPKGSMYVD